MNYLKSRSEFLFIYAVKDTNPNGDFLDENKSRVDEETGQVIFNNVLRKAIKFK